MANFEENIQNVLQCESCKTNITLVKVIACEICKVIGCDECVKTECQHCGIVMCRNCININDIKCDVMGKCKYCEAPNAPYEMEKVEEFFNCESCETDHPLEKAVRCEFCNINDESDDNDEDEVSVDSWDGKIKHLFCKECTLMCDACEIRGCKECVEFVCCDCGYDMCIECRNNDNIGCGCYGKCYSCGDDINRGSEGWPCGECEKWYCHGCRRGDNPCKECGPEEEEEEDNESVEEEK